MEVGEKCTHKHERRGLPDTLAHASDAKEPALRLKNLCADAIGGSTNLRHHVAVGKYVPHMPVAVYPVTDAMMSVRWTSFFAAVDQEEEESDLRGGRGRAQMNMTVEYGTAVSRPWRLRRSIVTDARCGGSTSAVDKAVASADAQM